MIENIMSKLSVNDQQEMARFSHIVNDPLSRRVLAKLASPHTPMCFNDIPLAKLDTTSTVMVISKLNLLEKAGLAESKMIKNSNGSVYKTYHATDVGTETANKYMRIEAEQYS